MCFGKPPQRPQPRYAGRGWESPQGLVSGINPSVRSDFRKSKIRSVLWTTPIYFARNISAASSSDYLHQRQFSFAQKRKPPARETGGTASVLPVLLHAFCGCFLGQSKLLGNLLGHQSLVFQEFLEREHQRLDTLFHALFHATLHAFFPYTLA